MALNEMFGLPLLTEDLAAVALELGADVPFFLERRACSAGGIGEVLDPIENWPTLWYVIVVPPISVSTSWVYGQVKSLEITGSTTGDRGLRLTEKAHRHIIKSLAERLTNIRGILANDLEAVTISHFPVIEEIKHALLNEGAKGALMSGSGPSVFGVFASEEDASMVSKSPAITKLGDVFVAKGIG
jgi:4-diphosphocytidyl-2-C-methyl-D-erythritol kinase